MIRDFSTAERRRFGDRKKIVGREKKDQPENGLGRNE
jgi:hypothetical protein